jgi:hypothetical protein
VIPLYEVAEELGLEQSDHAKLQRRIDGATALLGRELNRFLGTPTEVVELYRGGKSLVVLNDEPVAIEDELEPTVVVEIRASLADAWEVAELTDYVLEGRALRHLDRWPQGVRVTYNRGFETGDGPAELQAVVRRMVLDEWNADNAGEMKSETIGDYSYTRADLAAAVPGGDWEAFAKRWRRVPV